MTTPDAFYVPDGARFVPSELTRGPWDRRFQHGGPVAALLARSMERSLAGEPERWRLARITVELARPAPIEPCAVRAETVRIGRRVATLVAELGSSDRLIARASGLFVRELDHDPPQVIHADRLLPGPAQSPGLHLPFFIEPVGYHTAMELRQAHGHFGSGKLACWMRMGVPLVAGEATPPSARVLVAADSGNGVSMALDPGAWTFLNADLVVTLQRLPRGDWIGMDAATLIEHGGVGLADTGLYDEQGPIGRGTQTLVIEPRR
jgi:hypothetical protein